MTAASRPPAPTRIPGYGLAQPTEADVLAALQRVWGDERAPRMWAQACRDAGISAGHVDTLDRLEKVNRALATQGGATATLARSIEIRISTYLRLQQRAATGGAR